MSFFQIRKKVHWSDTDAAGAAWFPNFLGWFEDAEEEKPHQFGMPRVEVLRLVSGLADLAERQARGAVELPWT